MPNNEKQLLQSFDGTARLFPLPNLVMFPYAAQGLHIFEPRYRQMTADALAGDRLIALALLAPGWEADYEGRPPVRPVACLARIVAQERLDDGRYNLQIKGLCRVRILEELLSSKPYRTARVRVLPECNLPALELERDQKERFIHLLPSLLPGQDTAIRGFSKLFQGLPLGIACDILSFALPLPLDAKQELLECPDLTRRCRLLLGHLKTAGPFEPVQAKPDFPPQFSEN